MGWPKIVEIGGMRVPIDSWGELKEAYQEFGMSAVTVTANSDDPMMGPSRRNEPTGNLGHGDRTLLAQFIEAGPKGLLTGQLAQALGKQGKGVRPALERWSRKIGLVTEDNLSAFEAIKRFDGRGFKMIEHFRRTAASMLGQPVP